MVLSYRCLDGAGCSRRGCLNAMMMLLLLPPPLLLLPLLRGYYATILALLFGWGY